ncbi:MAG: acetyl-CoA C-acyltransferase, partial [Candidatus Bathyarchaeota archaeon]|nr:acetyl-CoA C-acyltransferase [Candidatus Bathyarchaeota archaeon]
MRKMREVVIVDYLRSAFSRSRPAQPERDKLNNLRADHIAATLIERIVERNKIDLHDIGEVQIASAFG